MEKKRLDLLVFERGLAPSRERAQSFIIAGKVLVNDVPVTKPGHAISISAAIRVRGEDHPYVSRGGLKLQAALDRFQINVAGRVALDVGASTGGFTHVLLLREIQRVYAIDVGYNQLDLRIRKDPRVQVFEKVNARHLEFSLIGEKVDVIVVDVSFISLKKIIPSLLQFAQPSTDWVTLIKPQFEVGKELVGKGGIVQSEDARQSVIQDLIGFAASQGLMQQGLMDSPILGTEGNKEFLAHWKMVNKQS